VLDELHSAVFDAVPPAHDGAFARGTVEVCLAILESSRTNAEIPLPLDERQARADAPRVALS
jgi:phthalate 4,5-cis-dihydrodiol dehydrogenase